MTKHLEEAHEGRGYMHEKFGAGGAHEEGHMKGYMHEKFGPRGGTRREAHDVKGVCGGGRFSMTTTHDAPGVNS